ncbi:MAG TPA: peroxiredoxin [Alphaproteobacteria bacterium]
MAIQIGDKFPSATLRRLGASGMEDVNTADVLAGKKVILFGLPGAYTPPCSQKHLPGYVKNADAIKAQGIDAIICLSANDPFVMKQWMSEQDPSGKLQYWPDGNGTLRDALGLTLDAAGNGLGQRFQRFVMTIENGIVKSLDVEKVASDVELSGADVCLANLSKKAA